MRYKCGQFVQKKQQNWTNRPILHNKYKKATSEVAFKDKYNESITTI
jgi:hypothetical protein